MNSSKLQGQPLISVIVVVYNTVQFLEKCLSSISGQTHRNVEIIIIDDGSSDGSTEVLENYCKKEDRSKLLKKKNQGVAAARNEGLRLASGEYIIFCDSDDYLEVNGIEKLLEKSLSECADITIGSYYVINESKKINIITTARATTKEIIEDILEGRTHAGLWTKLIKKSAIGDLYFEPEINYMEDYLFLCRLFSRKRIRASFTSCAVYNYIQRRGSYSSTMSEHSLKAAMKVTQILEGELKTVASNKSIAAMKAFSAALEIKNTAKKITRERRNEIIKHLKSYKTSPFKKMVLIMAAYNIRAPLKIATALTSGRAK